MVPASFDLCLANRNTAVGKDPPAAGHNTSMDVRDPSSRDRHLRFEEIAAGVLDPLERYLRRRATSDDAADVLNDTLLVLWRRLDDVPAAATLPWCYAVARRCLANHRRAARRQLALLERVRDLFDRTRPDVAGRAAPDAEPLSWALTRLSGEDREVIRLWAWEELEPREIAVVLEVSPNAVSIRLHRARKRLAALIEQHPLAHARPARPERPTPDPDTTSVSTEGEHP